MLYDLHCHSNCSDGELAPTDLIARAIDHGVEVLSITDHDTADAYQQLPATQQTLTLIPGIEFSTSWQKIGIHIVGLNIDPTDSTMVAAINLQQSARQRRAETIAQKLEKLGAERPLEGAQAIAGNAGLSRPHFAQYLVESGFCKDYNQAFKKYLGAGKPGDVKQEWACLQDVVDWIRGSGGIAVLAHPHKYKMTRSKLLRLIEDFKSAGGEAMEVLSGKQTPDITQNLQGICEQMGLLASIGSDFHHTQTSWCYLGMHPHLPNACKPVWERF